MELLRVFELNLCVCVLAAIELFKLLIVVFVLLLKLRFKTHNLALKLRISRFFVLNLIFEMRGISSVS